MRLFWIKESKEDNQALTAEVDSRRAQIRHKNALQTLHREVAKQQEEANRHIIARQTALELEKARAAEIASKPPPPPDPVVKIEAPKGTKIQIIITVTANPITATEFI